MLKDRIKKLRKEKKLSQRELAKKINLSPSTIAMYETGQRKPDTDKLKQIADFFNVSIDYLLGNTDEKKPVDEIIKNEEAVEIKELMERYQVMLERDELDESAKKSVIDFLRLLRDRDNGKDQKEEK